MEEIDTVSVDAKVAVGGQGGDGLAAVGDGRAGEVEGVAEAIDDELNDVGVGDEGGIIEGAAGRDHGERGVGPELAGEGIDERWVEKGFVALDVNDVSGGVALGGGFGDAVGAGGVVGAGADDAGADGVAEPGNAVIVGGDDEFIEFLAEGSTFENVLEKRFAEKGMEGLSGEACGGPAGRNNANDLCFFVVNKDPP